MARSQLATIGGGCFWCLEAIYQRLNGVTKVTSGYSGGDFPNPSAYDVYAGKTGHAEVVQIEFDPKVVSFRQILEIFYVMHDPTTLNRQGNDVGEEYRSVIFYYDAGQKAEAEDVINNFARQLWAKPIVTEIKPFKKFWPAAREHQNFYNNNRQAGYCQIIIEPKIAKLRHEFANKLRPL